MAKEENGIFWEERNPVSLRERLISYVRYWPLFLGCVIITVGCGMLYIRYSVPKYLANTSFLIKGAEGRQNTEDLIDAALSGKKDINLNNEILQVSSASLMRRTVANHGYNISYYQKGSILDLDVYRDAPFVLSVKQLTDSSSTQILHITDLDSVGGKVSYGSEKSGPSIKFKWDESFKIAGQTFILLSKKAGINKSGEYTTVWKPVDIAADEISKNLIAKVLDTKTSVINLSLKNENLNKGTDILNSLVSEFNLADIEDRNKLSESTVRFIDERLVAISGELKGVEGNLENYQGSKQLVDIKGQTTQSLENSNVVSQNIKGLSIQQGVASMLQGYLTNPSNNNTLVPSSLGLNDPTLSSLIGKYNELQLTKERQAQQVAPNSTVMQDLNTQIESVKNGLQENLNSVVRSLKLQESSLQQQNNQYRGMLSSLPHNERVLQEIKRKQNITEGLYLYLFQKREEAAISSTASNLANYKQLDPASGFGPVEPNKLNILIYSALLGFAIAFGYIYLRNLLNDKIISKEDITGKVNVPILGEISHIPKNKKKLISVIDRSLAGEQFRAIRTNLSYLLKHNAKKTVLITSSISDEGKSFVSLNLAAVFAMPGKKVALLEFDIRQPVLSDQLGIDSSMGLTNYLNGEITSLAKIRKVHPEIPGLHIYPCGPLPNNPADLLLTENMVNLYSELKLTYDYIITDCSPASLVSDAFILGEHNDMVVYITRSQKTPKKQVNFLKEIVENNRLDNVTVILNDVDEGNVYGSGYGAGNKYYTDNVNQSPAKKVISLSHISK